MINKILYYIDLQLVYYLRSRGYSVYYEYHPDKNGTTTIHCKDYDVHGFETGEYLEYGE